MYSTYESSGILFINVFRYLSEELKRVKVKDKSIILVFETRDRDLCISHFKLSTNHVRAVDLNHQNYTKLKWYFGLQLFLCLALTTSTLLSLSTNMTIRRKFLFILKFWFFFFWRNCCLFQGGVGIFTNNHDYEITYIRTHGRGHITNKFWCL